MGFLSWYFVVYAVCLRRGLPEAGAVLFQNAAVHDHEDAGLAGFLCRFLLNDSLLHPNHRYLQADRLVHNFFDKFRPAEDTDDIDFFRHFEQRRIRSLSQRPVDLRIDWNDAITVCLHVRRHSVTGTQRAVGKSNDRNGPGALEQVRDGIRLRQGSHAGIVVRRSLRKPVETTWGQPPSAVGRSKAALPGTGKRRVEFHSTGPPRAAVPTWSFPGNQRLLLLSIFCLNIFVASLRTVSEISLLLERLRRSPISMFFMSPSERSSGVRGLNTRLRTMA